jgi:hypothetical protein
LKILKVGGFGWQRRGYVELLEPKIEVSSLRAWMIAYRARL